MILISKIVLCDSHYTHHKRKYRVNVLVANNAYDYLAFPFTVSYIILAVLHFR